MPPMGDPSSPAAGPWYQGVTRAQRRARAAASGIFHASSVLGTFLAVAAGLFVDLFERDTGWRVGFLLGVVPALLILWIRVGMGEPESWREARARATQDSSQRLGRPV